MKLTAALIAITCFPVLGILGQKPAAAATADNSQEFLCTFENGAATCTKEFTLAARLETGLSGPIYEPLTYNLRLDLPDYYGWVEWHVLIYNGKKWVDRGALQWNHYGADQTYVTASGASGASFRVTIKVVATPLPPADTPAKIIATPRA